jgi:hypothetical protein
LRHFGAPRAKITADSLHNSALAGVGGYNGGGVNLMTYRGVVSNGVVVLEGEKPEEGTIVEVTPVPPTVKSLAELPAFGMWRDRTDLPADSAEAARVLRERAER